MQHPTTNFGKPQRPSDLKGLWRRRWIRWPDGREDAATDVYWLQTDRFYADVRFPPARPTFSGVGSLAQLTPTQREWLATQEGFAGELELHPDGWLWRRDVNYQPPNGARDIGRLTYLDPDHRTMLEEGVDAPYTELWQRVDASPDSTLWHTPPGHPTRGILAAVGGHYLLAIDHRKALAIAPSLTALLKAGAPPETLDMEISIGRRRGSPDTWIIERSTLPWRESHPLFAPAARLPDLEAWLR